MNKIWIVILISLYWLVTGCAVKTPVVNQYKLDSFSSKPSRTKPTSVSLLISQPEAVGGYQTEQMLYLKKPYELDFFVHNAWVTSPANMLLPLIMQSLQNSGYFYAINSPPYGDKADYRLDTQLIKLQQNFLVKPSVIELVIKVVLTHVADGRIIASRIISERVDCPTDTPYGGVVAANQAVRQFTATLSDFIATHVSQGYQPHAMLPQAIAKRPK